MRTEQITVTFPSKKKGLKRELEKRKVSDCMNISAYVVDLIEKDLGYLSIR